MVSNRQGEVIDYSFVVEGRVQPSPGKVPASIESFMPVADRQWGKALELCCPWKKCSQSCLTNLWRPIPHQWQPEILPQIRTTHDRMRAYFTGAVLHSRHCAGTHWGMKGNASTICGTPSHAVMTSGLPLCLAPFPKITPPMAMHAALAHKQILPKICRDHRSNSKSLFICFRQRQEHWHSQDPHKWCTGPKMAEKDLQNIASIVK